DGFAHVDFLTQCPTWNKDGAQYVPYVDVNESEDYDFDVTDRQEAAEMMHQTEQTLYEGKVLTGRYYVDDRRTYQEEKKARGEMPESPLVERYFDDEYEWERSYERLDRHT
ncbi:MAG: 2-ketoglutarate ferredoxin oxidoreductase subunit beta, partial [Halodesulfurarchaeum sp.]